MAAHPLLDGAPDDAVRALARAKLLALDVDGTLTSGRVTYVGEDELQVFCVRDGQGLAWLRSIGMRQTWITGRGCRATERRAEELGVDEYHHHAGPKDEALADVQERLGVSIDETIAMGDDLPDLRLARRAGVFVAPADACADVRAAATFVTTRNAGDGAVRELAEAILVAKGAWRGVLERYGVPRS